MTDNKFLAAQVERMDNRLVVIATKKEEVGTKLQEQKALIDVKIAEESAKYAAKLEEYSKKLQAAYEKKNQKALAVYSKLVEEQTLLQESIAALTGRVFSGNPVSNFNFDENALQEGQAPCNELAQQIVEDHDNSVERPEFVSEETLNEQGIEVAPVGTITALDSSEEVVSEEIPVTEAEEVNLPMSADVFGDAPETNNVPEGTTTWGSWQ